MLELYVQIFFVDGQLGKIEYGDRVVVVLVDDQVTLGNRLAWAGLIGRYQVQGPGCKNLAVEKRFEFSY
jgi:hypothetical protein